MAANIKIIRFLNGQEIVAEVTLNSLSEVTVKNPVRLVVIPSKTSPQNPQVAFVPFCEFSDDKEFTFQKQHIIAQMTPIAEFINQYNGMFGGVILPTSKLII